MLEVLDIRNNHINSQIPLELGNLKRLIHLDLSFNLLSGTIPPTLGNLTNLAYLSMEGNQFSGSIPSEVGNLKSLTHLDLSFNKFFGNIPHEFESLVMLSYLDLRANYLQGSIPNFKKLFNLSHIDLSNNDLTENVSYVAFQGNEESGGVDGSMTEVIMTVTIPLMAIAFVFGLILHRTKSINSETVEKNGGRTKSKKSETVEKNGDFLSIWNYDGRIAYEDIINATEDFHIKYCIGTGGYGSVYRAQLPNGKIVALKKLHRLEAEDPSFDKSFRNEVKHLTEVRHRSIIKLHGFCLHRRCMFLVYEYMERGSLFCALRDDVEAMELDWSKRLNIVWDVAHALSYLHHDCGRPIVHRDISSNNILLDNKMQAFLSDFGTARLLEPNFSSNITANIAGTHGYIAPGEQQSSILF
ncbi:MDIS1-interacting receptor like kinase 2-like [Syzygium oleosum]|uniref:MDIS1-interacting receptor like kinase 2-like n=1 Tax=Syzygium oleosum TaxID=219896 RepID=UPI0024BA5E35|nr:MDIS1-interacting receptor like kinase 2-like [Syzygium oleosum]